MCVGVKWRDSGRPKKESNELYVVLWLASCLLLEFPCMCVCVCTRMLQIPEGLCVHKNSIVKSIGMSATPKPVNQFERTTAKHNFVSRKIPFGSNVCVCVLGPGWGRHRQHNDYIIASERTSERAHQRQWQQRQLNTVWRDAMRKFISRFLCFMPHSLIHSPCHSLVGFGVFCVYCRS